MATNKIPMDIASFFDCTGCGNWVFGEKSRKNKTPEIFDLRRSWVSLGWVWD